MGELISLICSLLISTIYWMTFHTINKNYCDKKIITDVLKQNRPCKIYGLHHLVFVSSYANNETKASLRLQLTHLFFIELLKFIPD